MKRIATILSLLLVLALASPISAIETYHLKLANLTTTSQSFNFAFNAKIVIVYADAANTANVCVDFKGSTTVCPSANVAGDMVLAAGMSKTLDGFREQRISVIAASGTQIIYIDAWQ